MHEYIAPVGLKHENITLLNNKKVVDGLLSPRKLSTHSLSIPYHAMNQHNFIFAGEKSNVESRLGLEMFIIPCRDF